MHVSVVGLGPGPKDWITLAATARLRWPGARVYARTRFFPGLDEILSGIDWESFDELYESARTLDEVNAEIVRRLLRRDGEGDVVLAVPGDGVLGEDVVGRLIEGGASLEVVPGVPLSIGALAAARVPS